MSFLGKRCSRMEPVVKLFNNVGAYFLLTINPPVPQLPVILFKSG